ncbi:MerR family transcriptional regulator [Cytobacillus sp. FJAT-54145]|uniref:MerR family transcriptional regulator n=1 Tax=Cytobacillus spartinae TaxID=3299023 RepID=A0ABW6KIH1_9BACI
MSNGEGKYNIKAVSKMLGIQAGTLRAWERRYQMVAPTRNESGHRLYTEEHVKILRFLISKVNEGFTISQAVSLLENNELGIAPRQYALESNQASELSDKLLQALLNFDETKSHDLISEAFSLYTIDKVVVEILGDILIRIGELWEKGKITTAHEHYATAILRSRIGSIFHSFPNNSFLPKVIAVCGPGERHELGLLIFTLFLRRKGFDVIYLGASIEENDLYEVIKIVKPKFLFFSVTMKEHVGDTLDISHKLLEVFNELKIGVGGHAMDKLTEREKEEHSSLLLGSTKLEWEQWLKVRL